MSRQSKIRLKQEVARARRAIKQKALALKRGQVDFDIETSRAFKPLVEPLEKLASNNLSIDKINVKTKVEKPEPEFIVDDAAYEEEWPNLSDHPIFNHETPVSLLRRTSGASSTMETPKRGSFYPSFAMDDPTEYIHNPEIRESFNSIKEVYGPLATRYIGSVTANKDLHDSTYGVTFHPDGVLKLGSAVVDFEINDKIHVNSSVFQGTPGLYELLFLKNPSPSIITNADLENYKKILQISNVHRVGFEDTGRLRSTRMDKYTRFIGKLFPSTKRVTGKGFIRDNTKNYNYIYWNDVNELISRLEVLIAAKKAGNSGLDPEISSILEELRENGTIH